MTAKKKLAAILLCGLIIGGGANALTPSQAHCGTFKLVFRSGNYEADRFAVEVLNLVNAERAKVGVQPLRLAGDLQRAAAIRAREIITTFSHTRPNGERFSSLLPDGRYRCGENIAAGCGSAKETVEQWMQSPGHRENILRPEYDELGVGYAYDGSTPWKHHWVQIFRRPLKSAIQYRR